MKRECVEGLPNWGPKPQPPPRLYVVSGHHMPLGNSGKAMLDKYPQARRPASQTCQQTPSG